jgi:hypothetical protein
MTKDDLMKFCHTDPERFNISVPWSAGEYSYATNGHVIIRVPRLVDVQENDSAPPTVLLFPYADPLEWFALAEIELPEQKSSDCPECNGEKEVEHEDCPHCKGHPCEWCDGTGKVTPMQPVPVGNSHYQLVYLLTLKGLANCRMGPNTDPMKQTPFQFDGGDGLIMPMKKFEGGWSEVKA